MFNNTDFLFTMDYNHKKGHRPHKRSNVFPIKSHLEHDGTQSVGKLPTANADALSTAHIWITQRMR